MSSFVISDDVHDKLSGNSLSLRRRFRCTLKSDDPEADPVVTCYRTRRTRCSSRLAMKAFSMKLPDCRLPDLPEMKSKLRLLNEVILGKNAKEKKMIKRHPDLATHYLRESLTKAEAEIYIKTVIDRQIHPLLDYTEFTKKNLRLGIRLAVKKDYHEEPKRLEVIEVSKANFQGWAPCNYYITFKARDEDGDIKDYQTLLITAMKRSNSIVQFVRLKPEGKKEWGAVLRSLSPYGCVSVGS